MKPLNQIQISDVQEFLKKIPPRTWLIISGYAVAAVAFIYLIFIPAWITRFHVKTQIKEIRIQMATTQNLLKKQPELIRNKESFIKVSQEVKKRLYQPGEASLLLGVISKMAEESKVSVVASSPKKYDGKFPAPFDVQYEGNAYQFTVEGGYHDLAEFVSKIENSEKILRIQNFSLVPQDKGAGKHLAEINLSAVSVKSASGAK